MNTMNKEGVPRQRTSRGEGGGRGTGGIGWHRVTTLEEGAVSRVSAHRDSGWASLTKNKMSPPPLEILLRDNLSRARHRRRLRHLEERVPGDLGVAERGDVAERIRIPAEGAQVQLQQ